MGNTHKPGSIVRARLGRQDAWQVPAVLSATRVRRIAIPHLWSGGDGDAVVALIRLRDHAPRSWRQVSTSSGSGGLAAAALAAGARLGAGLVRTATATIAGWRACSRYSGRSSCIVRWVRYQRPAASAPLSTVSIAPSSRISRSTTRLPCGSQPAPAGASGCTPPGGGRTGWLCQLTGPRWARCWTPGAGCVQQDRPPSFTTSRQLSVACLGWVGRAP
jgi:hypothetical protein